MKKNIVMLAALTLSICSLGTAHAEADKGKNILKQYVNVLAAESDSGKRQDAFKKMSEFEPQTEGQIDFILNAIKSDDRKVSLAGQRALGNVKDKKLVPKVIAALEDKDRQVKVGAIRAAGKLKDKRAVPFLLRHLDEDEFVASNASFALANIGDEDAIPALLERIGKRNGSFATALAMFGASALDAIVENVLDENKHVNKKQRLKKIQAIGFIKDRKAIPLLKKMLKNEDEKIRVASAMALSNLGELPVADTIKDSSPSVRLCVIEASRNLNDPQINHILTKVFAKDDRYEVRILAAKVLAHRKSYEAIPYLEEGLTDTNKEIRIVAKEALEAITNDIR